VLLEYIVTAEDEGKTVKQIISREFALSSRLLSKLKNESGIKVNGVSVTVRRNLCYGDKLTLEMTDVSSKNVTQSDIELDVLYEDESMLAVNKPLGMPTHPSQGHHDDTLANAVMYRYRNENFTFRAITRLDGDTTGVVLVARNALSAQRLTDMLQNGKIKKEYVALTVGVPQIGEGTIDAPIGRCEDSIIKRKIVQIGKKSQISIDEQTLLEYN
jgi:23S rRNA pseudouridine1911/1915/1917 synthase